MGTEAIYLDQEWEIRWNSSIYTSESESLRSTQKCSVNVSYSLNLITMKNFDNILANTKPKYGEGNVKNITVDKADPVFWFPYPVSIREKKNNPILLRHLKVYNFVYASSISTIMSRNHL